MPSPAPAPDRNTTPVRQTRSVRPRGEFPPGTRIGGWRICSVLGEGATGRVYEVEHQRLGTRRALKVLSWAHPVLQARLMAEGRAQATLLHPNVVPVVDMMSIGDIPALVMELVDGPSLESWLSDHHPTPEEAELIFRGILAGVETAHAAGLVHRDLKPANVLMAKVGDGWVPKVTDFGLAKDAHADLGLTQTGMTMGTPGFMSPEQIRNPSDVDQRADIFSLGCILYQLLCGHPPHDGPDALAVLNAVAEGSVTPLTQSVPGLSRRLVRTVTAAMAIDREARPAGCAELRDLLDGPRPPPQPESPRPASSPGWGAWLSLAVVMALIGVGGVVSSLVMASRSVLQVDEPRPSLEIVEASPGQGLPDEASIIIPEPWVPDDIDPAVLIPEPEREPEVQRTSRTAAMPAVAAVVPAPVEPCTHGWVRLPWLARSPDPGGWEIRKVRQLFRDPLDLSPLCDIPDGSEVIVVQEAIRTEEGRFVEVVVR